jgi:dihydropteroate synthase
MILAPTDINLRDSHTMAIINLTPDSFYSGSRNASVEEALRSIERCVREGATIVDLGGYSSRPGAAEVSVEEESRRVKIGLEAVKATTEGVVVSIDTFRSAIVERAFSEYGDFIANDISAGEQDEAMASVVARYDIPYVAMHMRGDCSTMQSLTDYADVTAEVKAYFKSFAQKARECGVKNWVLDPGFGFAKTVEQNYALLNSLSFLRDDYQGYSPKILVGVSRKSMIYKPLGITPEEALSATQAVHAVALMNGADILRVHDVSTALQTVTLYKYL